MSHPTPFAQLLPVPEGTRLVHIGPPKTGTTTLQAAFDRARDSLLPQGVRYAGPRRHSREAAMAASRTGPGDGRGSARGEREWQAIVGEMRSATEGRVVFSSERLSHAGPDAIREIVDQLGVDRLRIAVTLRPLWKVLPSQWQQGVQGGLVGSIDDWLRDALASGADDLRSVWYRHRHDRLIERWGGVVGIDRITVIVADDRDRTMLLRAFEQLLELEAGTLRLHDDLSNRSLTLPEIEAVRALNVELRAARLPPSTYRRLMETGASLRMKLRDPAPDEPPIELPAWAAPRVGMIAQEIVTGIARSGVQVVGDLDGLARMPDMAAPPGSDVSCITPAAAAALAAGLLETTGVMGSGAHAAGESLPIDLDRVPLRRLATVVARRVGQRAATRSRELLRGLDRR